MNKFLQIIFVYFSINLTVFAAEESELEKLLGFLKGKQVTLADLEKKYSCYSIEAVTHSGLSKIKEIEADVTSSRQNTNISALLPKLSAWTKYSNDEKAYLYQQNNISVGKDYITVGPDDNNKTVGTINSYEIGGKIEFDLSKLLYNSDTLKFTDQEQKLYLFRADLVDKITYVYYFAAVGNSLKQTPSEIPLNIMLQAEINSKKMKQWLRETAGIDLDVCGEKK